MSWFDDGVIHNLAFENGVASVFDEPLQGCGKFDLLVVMHGAGVDNPLTTDFVAPDGEIGFGQVPGAGMPLSRRFLAMFTCRFPAAEYFSRVWLGTINGFEQWITSYKETIDELRPGKECNLNQP